MNLHPFAAFAGLALTIAPLTAHAQAPAAPGPLRYRWAAGQTLRYLVMRDPYFDDPAKAIEAADPRLPYRPPIVERLTERVKAVAPDGTATLQVTVGPEPDFEDGARPAPPVSRTLTVTALGQVASLAPPTPAPDFFRAFFRLPDSPAGTAERGLAVFTRPLPPVLLQSTSPDHDGTLLQTTRATGSDRIVFDPVAGVLVRRTDTLTVAVSLVMTKRGARGGADFGHVVPNVQSVQTLTIERRDDLP